MRDVTLSPITEMVQDEMADGSAHESATMLENSIEEDLGSISMATTSKSILTGVLWF